MKKKRTVFELSERIVLEGRNSYNNLEAVKYLLENDYFDINYVSRRGTTALH